MTVLLSECMALRFTNNHGGLGSRKVPLDVKTDGIVHSLRSVSVSGSLCGGRGNEVAHGSANSTCLTDRPLLDQFERLYRQGMLSYDSHSSDVLLPMKPCWPGPLYVGKPVRVAYQGVRGSYCQEAAVRAFQGCDGLPCEGGMKSAFEALESDAAERAVLPVENSLDGVIGRNYDLMLRYPDLRVVGELLLPINHCLLAVRGAGKRPRALKRVISHPQALAHCQRHLAALGVQVEAVDNSASAARFVAENRIDDTAVIGSEIAGREYGLQVVEEEMQDDSSNTTRFLILKKPNNKNKNSSALPGSKTTVAFSLKEGTADLFKVLSIFTVRDIKVTKIESRPQRENPLRIVMNEEQRAGGSKCYFEYVFFVDLEGPVEHNRPISCEQIALDQLRQISSFVRVMGSYSTISMVSFRSSQWPAQLQTGFPRTFNRII